MQTLITFFTDPAHLISTIGTIGVVAVIFVETGFFFGFFLPGDSLLFTAGYLASGGHISLAGLLVGCFLAAAIGDSVGYLFGKKIGPAIFTKEDSILFSKKNIARAAHFYEEHGAKTIFLARFLPVVRTFAPVVAGVGNMEYRTFLTWNILGGFLWTWALIWLGYGLGALIPDPDRYILPAVIIIIFVSTVAPLREFLKARKL